MADPVVSMVTLVSITPNTAIIGSDSLTVTVNGTGFDETSKTVFDGVEKEATFVSANELTFEVNPSVYGEAVTVPVSVKTGYSKTPPLQFTFTEEPTGSGNQRLKKGQSVMAKGILGNEELPKTKAKDEPEVKGKAAPKEAKESEEPEGKEEWTRSFPEAVRSVDVADAIKLNNMKRVYKQHGKPWPPKEPEVKEEPEETEEKEEPKKANLPKADKSW